MAISEKCKGVGSSLLTNYMFTQDVAEYVAAEKFEKAHMQLNSMERNLKVLEDAGYITHDERIDYSEPIAITARAIERRATQSIDLLWSAIETMETKMETLLFEKIVQCECKEK